MQESISVSIAKSLVGIFPTDFIVINSGARFNYYNLSKHFFWEPRINVTFQPGKKYWSIKASIGSYKQVIHQLIEGNELGLGNELWAVSNLEDDIPVSSARQLNFGVNYKKENFLFDIQFFNKKISDIKFLETDGYGNLSDGFDIGSGNVNGIELLVKQKWRDKYGIWLAYSFSKSINQSEGIDSDMSFNADNDVPHSLKLVTSYNNQNWECSVLWSCESGQVYTPAINLQLINDGDDLDYVIQYENRNSKRLKPFHRLDLSANYNWLPKNRSIVVKFGTSILNVYNRNKSTDVKYVIIDEEDQEIRRFDRTQIGIVPNFFIKVEF